MTTTCPDGHLSQDPEWCDTCGARLAGAAAPLSSPRLNAPAAPPPRADVPCPHCKTPNESDALFCEACGYDFTTGQAPEPQLLAAPASPSMSGPTSTGWLLVVEVDPQWYEIKGQSADAPCPPKSSSTIKLSTHTVLIGRSSTTRNVHPEVTLDSDVGVSRRHAQLVLGPDATWTLVDLESSNGTYVVAAGEAPCEALDPIAPGVPTAVKDQDMIFVGAWTRLTLRNGG
jgi:FHA domain/Double zinc ribbon